MIAHEINPFQELYVTDSPDPNVFVSLFSDFPVRHAQFLFREGNVVLKGSQGSGKSMLLNLFRPAIRLAYANAKKEFPVPAPLRRFVGAGVNLRRSGALDIGQRPLRKKMAEEVAVFPLYFADFLNCFVVRDILDSVNVINKSPREFEGCLTPGHLDEFAQLLSRDDCWLSGIPPCESFVELCDSLDSRIQAYRGFHNYNSELPEAIHETKTAIGEPIGKAAECLRVAGVIDRDTPLFVRIDEVDRLKHSDIIRAELGTQYRRVINKALGMRESRVSYRIGARPYGWEDDLKVFGTEHELENIRDFRVVDLDLMLQRKEDRKTWIFPGFAEDAFRRRLDLARYEAVGQKNLVQWVFGATTPPEEAAKGYTRKSPDERILQLEDGWPEAWCSFLKKLFLKDPFDAVLAAAWLRQRGTRGKAGERMRELPPTEDVPKGKLWHREYWRKERVRQCLTQIASRSRQRLMWSGGDQIFALSSGNISIFLSICHDVWEAHLRSERAKSAHERTDPVRSRKCIHPDVQAVGIQTASDTWYEKITELPNGDDRQAFVNVLGKTFRTWLLKDEAMSYPGHNGFSLDDEHLRTYSGLARFLRDAVRYAALFETPHTTKEKNRRKRTKWYLSPILSPHFQIPEAHQKEPMYIRHISEVANWVRKAKVVDKDLEELVKLAPEGVQGEIQESTPTAQAWFDFQNGTRE